MVETDAPYLAPGKFRGKRNEPSYVVEVAKVLAETRGVSLEEISRQTTENFFRLFSKVPAPKAAGMTLTLTILGCGSSAGVPRPALGWGRLRSQQSQKPPPPLFAAGRADVGDGITRVVIDTSPDLREQLIDANVDRLDAVFLTHEHADQTHGIDDLRSVVLHQRRRIPVYFNQSTAKDIMARFSYCFVSPEAATIRRSWTGTRSRPAKAGDRREGRCGDAFRLHLQHGNIPALGYRIGDAAYTPDVSDIPARAGRARKSRLWIIDGLRYAAIRAISASTMRCPGSSASSRSARSSPTCIPTSITRCCG